MEMLGSIAALGRKYNADKIVLFGSRARGDNRERSDVDIAVFGLAKEKQVLFREEIEQLPTLLDFDIVFVNEKTDAALLENIRKDGKPILNKVEEKKSKFLKAIQALDEALAEYEKYRILSSRDGVIQRFEFCTELAWKATREYLIEQGYVELNSPKSVMKQAYADKLLDDEAAWLALLNARNLTSHIYDDETADEVFNDIKIKYVLLFKNLLSRLD